MLEELKLKWINLCSKQNVLKEDMELYWTEIKSQYTQKNRHYHNLNHIYDLLKLSENHKNDIVDFETFQFAIWYHDIVYNPVKKDNEAKSAIYAEKHLKDLDIDHETIKTLIISTQKHEIILNKNNDNAFLLDMDLSILGTNWKDYQKYLKDIRKEYAIFPNFMYNKGRKKVLQHFLNRKTLYFTDYFKAKYEAKARENINKEIKLL